MCVVNLYVPNLYLKSINFPNERKINNELLYKH